MEEEKPKEDGIRPKMHARKPKIHPLVKWLKDKERMQPLVKWFRALHPGMKGFIILWIVYGTLQVCGFDLHSKHNESIKCLTQCNNSHRMAVKRYPLMKPRYDIQLEECKNLCR